MNTGNRSARNSTAPQPISSLIDKVLGKLGLSMQYRGWRVVAEWPQIVGTQIATRSQAIRYSDGVLYVAVKDAVWRQELAMQTGEFLEKIHEYPFGRAVKQIRLVSGEKRAEQNDYTGE